MKNKVGRLIEMIVAKLLFAIAILFMSVTRTQRAQAVTYDTTGNVAWCNSALKAALNDTDAYLPAALGSDYATYVIGTHGKKLTKKLLVGVTIFLMLRMLGH